MLFSAMNQKGYVRIRQKLEFETLQGPNQILHMLFANIETSFTVIDTRLNDFLVSVGKHIKIFFLLNNLRVMAEVESLLLSKLFF